MRKLSENLNFQTITRDDSDPLKEHYRSSLGVSFSCSSSGATICDERTGQRVELHCEVSWIKGDPGAEPRAFVGLEWNYQGQRWDDGTPVTEEQEARIRAFIRAIRFSDRPIYSV